MIWSEASLTTEKHESNSDDGHKIKKKNSVVFFQYLELTNTEYDKNERQPRRNSNWGISLLMRCKYRWSSRYGCIGRILKNFTQCIRSR